MFTSLLILISIRPFISSLAFPYANLIYSAILVVFLISWLIYKGISFKNIQILKYSLILFSLAIIISTIFSIDKFNSLKEIYKYITGILLLIITASLTSKEKIRIIHTLIFAGFVIGLLAIYQYFFGFQHILNYIAKLGIIDPFVLDYISRKRVFFPFVTPNTLAGYIILIIPITLIIKGRKKWFILLPIFFALLLTKSLGAFLSLFLGTGLYLYLKRDLTGKKFALLGILAAISIFIFILRQASTKEHLLPAFSFIRRMDYWQDTLEIIKTHPIAGVGLGNFNLIFSRYAHNSYLQIWAEMGILGIISILWLILLVTKSALKDIKNFIHRNQIIYLLTANTVFLIHNLVDFTFFLPEVALIWWVILGLILS